MKNIITILTLTIVSIINISAQNKNDTAKAYYIEAEKNYGLKKYQSALENLNKVEEVLGNTNARVLALKVKSFYNIGEFTNAKKMLSQFSNYNASEALKNEVLAYIIKIDNKLEKQKEKEKKLRVAKIRAEEKKKRLENEKKEELLKLDQLIKSKLLTLETNNYDWSKNHNLAVIEGSKVYGNWGKTFGLINKNGDVKIPIKYDKIVLEENIAYVMNNPGYSSEEVVILNLKSGVLNSTKYDDLTLFGDNILIFENENSFKIINSKLKNNVIYESKKRTRNRFSVKADIDYDLDIIYIEGTYQDNYDFTNFAIIHKNGKFIVPIDRYYEIGNYHEGLAEVKKNGRYGLIDINGKEIVSPKYKYIRTFSDGLCLVQSTNGRWGYINENGVEVLPPIYYDAQNFKNGIAFVRFEKYRKLKRINKKGKKVRR